MKALTLGLAAALLLGTAVTTRSQDPKDAGTKTDKSKLVGVWEFARADSPGTVEFTKDGKLKLTAKVGGNTHVIEGTYEVTGQRLTLVQRPEGREQKKTFTIRTLDDKHLVTVDESGKVDELKRVKR